MQYFITFLEGLMSFISPCMLPMLPIYITYFAGNADKKHNIFLKVCAFVLGFTAVFTLLGVFAGVIGSILVKYRVIVNAICGTIVIIFGLSYLEVFRIPFFKGMNGARNVRNVFSAFLFGMIYSVNLTPCVGVFLGSALMTASLSGHALTGSLLLVTYSLGLGVPFMFSAVLIDKLNGVFGLIKRHYKIVNIVCGIFLIIVGVMMMFGMMDRLLSFLA